MALSGKALVNAFIQAANNIKLGETQTVKVGGRLFEAERIASGNTHYERQKGNSSVHFELSEEDQQGDILLHNLERDRHDKVRKISVHYNDKAGVHVRAHCDVETARRYGGKPHRYTYFSTQKMVESGLKL